MRLINGGTGRAFVCKALDCGTEVKLYVRAKLGSCNCSTGVADDADLDRMSDFDLIGAEVSPLGAGRPITVAWMKGRSRGYALSARNPPGKSAISVVFNDRCDMIVATVVLPHDTAGKHSERGPAVSQQQASYGSGGDIARNIALIGVLHRKEYRNTAVGFL